MPNRHCAALVLLVLVSSLATALTQTQSSIPYVLHKKGSQESIRHGHQAGQVQLRALANEVNIEWIACESLNQVTPPTYAGAIDFAHNAIGGKVFGSALQTIRTQFAPTACCLVDNESILIAGITSTDSTVIERWVLAWPKVMPAPFYEPDTGLTYVKIALPSIAQTTRLAEEKTAGRMYVRNLCALRRSNGRSTEAIVQFHDSSELFVINLASAELYLLASPSSSAGTLGLIPSLNCACHHSISFGDRIGVGYSYLLGVGATHQPSAPTPDDPPTLILMDVDRDGRIESYAALSYEQYVAQGWRQLTNYARWWLP